MNNGTAVIPRESSLEHILLDYPVSTEESVSKRYTFFYDLGSGAYASVRYGTCCKTNEGFAVKIISKTKTPRDYLKKFVPREVDALKRLSIHSHPNICQMREFFETPHRVYLVTRLATGGDLLTFINSRKYLNEDIVKRMAAEILCALDHIHDLNIVHRDLKCENLLIGPEDCIIVTDFGFATQQPKNRLLTTFCGSYAYAAPEILTGSSYNGKCTDVWSVGVILYAMLNGKLPFNDTKPKNILAKIKTNPLVFSRRVSMACEKFVRHILTIPSMERPTVTDLLLKKWLDQPLSRVLKKIPEPLHPGCLKLTLPKRSSFKMSDTSEECLRIRSSRDSHGAISLSRSPHLPIKITNEFVAHHISHSRISHRTSSTISERLKIKYLKVKTDLRTWASRKRKGTAVSPHDLVNIGGKPGAAHRPATGNSKLIRISEPNTNQGQHETFTRMKYVVGESNQGPTKKVLDITTARAVSAVPPPTTTTRRKSIEQARAKSCKPPAEHTTHGDSKTKSKNSGKESGRKQRQQKSTDSNTNHRKKSGTGDSGVHDQIIQYLTQQREQKSQALKPTNLGNGLPPLQRNKPSKTRVSPNKADKPKSKRRSSTNSTRRSSDASNTTRVSGHTTVSNTTGGSRSRKGSYDHGLFYHHIQGLSNIIDVNSRAVPNVTQTKLVSVNPKNRRPSYGSQNRKDVNVTITGLHDFTLYP